MIVEWVDGAGKRGTTAALHHLDYEATYPAAMLATIQEIFPAQAVLTAREIEVCACLVDGKTAPQTADALFISVKTVESHKSAIRRKLRVVLGDAFVSFHTTERMLYRAYYTRVGYEAGYAAGQGTHVEA